MSEIRVLYIEDDDAQRVELATGLRGRGFSVTDTNSGKDGLKLLSSQGADVVLCDLNMPGVGGFEVLKRMRENHPDVPVIM
ncbi:MAG TPA: response regulator, partial [Acidobacteriota bacterium]|nr:response regulator [Acidobacteriota bacterium]